MRKFYIYFNLLVLFLLASNLHAQNGTIGTAVEGIPDDWQNDLWLNTHFREMHVGDTYQLVARRVPEIIDNAIGNKITLPTFHYSVIRGESVSVDANGLITASALGTSIIKVTYDEKEANGTTYGAVSPVNISYMAVDVIAPNVDTGIKLSTDIALRSYDTYYFTDNSAKYAFTLTATGADAVSVKCNDVTATKKGDQYLVNLQNRANVIEIVATKNQVGSKKLYYVVDARKIELKIENATHPDKNFEAGDKARVSFKGITLPVYKLATIYNPQMNMPAWGATATKVHYTNVQIGDVKTNVNVTQYDLATNNTIELTLPEEQNYIFNDGHIYEYWWGSPLGTEKDMTGPGQPNLNADTMHDRFSVFPNFQISVGYQPASFENIGLAPQSYRYADASQAATYTTVNQALESGSFAFKNSATNWGSMTSWYGVAVSNQTDNVSLGNVNNQFNSAAGGDVSGTGNYGVIFDANSSGMNMGPDNAITFSNKDYPEGKIVHGCYVTNNTYGTNSMMNGDGFAKKFGGTTGNDTDFFKLTATGFDAAGTETGKVNFYLADYRFEDNQKDYIVKDWRWMDLSSLGQVSKIMFTISSSDAGEYGMNTPAYFCIDNINQPRLVLKESIATVSVNKNAADKVIDLSTIFGDQASSNRRSATAGEITNAVAYNTNSDLVSASISGNQLTLAFAPDKTGEAEISVKASMDKMGAYSTFLVKVGSALAIGDKIQENISIFPNPATHYFSANVNGQLEIFTAAGTKVYHNEAYIAQSKVDISGFDKGIYIVKLNNISMKLIKR